MSSTIARAKAAPSTTLKGRISVCTGRGQASKVRWSTCARHRSTAAQPATKNILDEYRSVRSRHARRECTPDATTKVCKQFYIRIRDSLGLIAANSSEVSRLSSHSRPDKARVHRICSATAGNAKYVKVNFGAMLLSCCLNSYSRCSCDGRRCEDGWSARCRSCNWLSSC